MTHVPSSAERAWIAAAKKPATAALLPPLAAAFNRLDVALLDPLLAEECRYESQSVIEELRGKADVLGYFGERFAALRAAGAGHLATAELAVDPGGEPAVLLRQRASAFGRPGLGSVRGFFRVAPAAGGKIGSIFLVTSVPPPGLCRGAGLFPALSVEELRHARDFEGDRIPLGPEVAFTLFAMPNVAPCDEMARDLRDLAPAYAPARFRLITPKNRAACIEHGVTGFPTLMVSWRGETVRVLDGYHANEQVRAALADLFAVPAED